MADLGRGPGGGGGSTLYFGQKRRNHVRKKEKGRQGKQNNPPPPPYLKVWIRHWRQQIVDLEWFSFKGRKVIGFAFATLHDWLKKFAPIFHPIRSKTKTNRDSLARVFPRFASATCNYFKFWLVHCIVCSSWLARVISLVLVLRHSTENQSWKASSLYVMSMLARCSWEKISHNTDA